MANAEARLRLIVEAVANTSGLNGLFGQLRNLGSTASGAFKGFDSVSGFSAFESLSNSVSNAKLRMVEMKDAAGNVKRVLEADVTNATQTATRAMSGFRAEVTTLREQLPKASDGLDAMARKFAFWTSIDMASNSLRRFGEQLAGQIMSGMEDAADKEKATIGLIEGVLVNNPDVAAKLNEGGAQAWEHFRQGLTDAVNDKAIEIGLNTTYSDNQIAQGMSILAQAGVDVQDILDGVAESMANIGMIADTDIVTSARGMVAIYNQFGDRLDEQFAYVEDDSERVQVAYQYVADVINNAMKASGMTFNELITALSYAGSASATAGQSFGDTAAVLALFSKNGISGSKAGTGLRRIITNLTPTTEKAAEAIRRMTETIGGSADVFYDAEGRMKSLSEVQELLYQAMSGKSPQEQIYLIKEVFGQYAIGQAVLMATSGEFGSLTDKINQQGTALRQVNAIMGSTAGITDRAGEAQKTFWEQIGTYWNTILNPFKTAYADLIENYLTKTPESLQQIVAAGLGFVAAFAVVLGTVGSAIAGFALFNLGLAAVGVSLGTLATGVGIFVAAIAAIAAVAYLVYEAWTNNWGGFRDFTIAIWNEVSSFVGGLIEEIKAWWNGLLPTVQQAGANIQSVWNSLVQFFNTYLLPALQVVWDSLVLAMQTMWETIKGLVQGTWLVISGIFQTFIALIAGDWTNFTEGLKRIWEGFVQIFETLWRGFWNLLFGIFENIMKWIADKWDLDWKNIEKIFTAWKDAFFIVFDAFWNALRGLFDVFVSLFKGDWQGAWDKIVEIMNSMKQAVLDAFDRIWTAVKDVFTGYMTAAYNWGRNLIQNFIDGVKAKWQALKDSVSRVASTVKDYLGFSSPTKEGPGSTADRWMPNLVDMMADGLRAGRPLLQHALDGVAGDISLGVNGVALGTPTASARTNNVNLTINYSGSANQSEVERFAREVRRQVAMVTTY